MDFLQEFVKLYIEESIADRFTRLARQLGPFRFAFLADRYKQLENLDDKFTFMWNLPEVQEYAKPPEVLPVVKDEDVAERLKTEGNILFKKKDFEGALMIYNIAIAFTPHPELCLSKENLKINTSDVNKFKTLGCCYANRSAVFLTMMDYEKCLRDIDLAFEYGYPDLLKSKLLERKERCLVAQKQMTEDGKLATNIQTAMRKAPVLEKYSDTVPGFSSALQLTYSELEGRHVIATRNIHPGEVLVVEESHCTDFIIKSSELHCSICLVKCNNPLPCPNCQELFCSDVCRATALKGIHGKDCIVLMKLLEVDSDIQHYTLINLMYQTTFAQLKEYLPEIEVEAKELPPEKLGYNRDGVYATDFRAVYHMPKEEQCDNSDELQFRCGFAAVFLTKLLHKRVNYFKNSLGVPVKPSHEDFILIGKVILDLYLKMPLMIALFTHSDGPPAVPGNHPVPITRGIFPRTLLLKHSCNPSAFTYNYENKMVTRAIAFIPAGEQVTIPYIVSFEKYSKNQRVDILKRWGGISCSCEACLNDWPIASLFLSELVHFKCPKCSIVVKGNSCIHCDINYQRQDYDGDKKLMVAKWNCNCYQFQQLSNEAKISFSNIFKYQISKEDFGNLSRFLEFLEKHVEIPCLPYILIRQHMCMYFLRE